MLTFALRNKPETCAREEKQTMMEIAWWSDGGYASTQIAPMQCTGPFLPAPPPPPPPHHHHPCYASASVGLTSDDAADSLADGRSGRRLEFTTEVDPATVGS